MTELTMESSGAAAKNCLFRASAADFKKIPGNPIAYWLSQASLLAFSVNDRLSEVAEPRQGLATTDNKKYLRMWFEIVNSHLTFGCMSREEAFATGRKWFPYNKGGEFRRWYGNNEYFVNWQHDGREIKEDVVRKYPYLNGNPDFVTKNQEYYFKTGITWTYINSAFLGMRHSPPGYIFDVAGSSVFPSSEIHYSLLGYLCSKVSKMFIDVINPTMNIQAGNVGKLPVNIDLLNNLDQSALRCLVGLSRNDWDFYETSWDFSSPPLLHPEYYQSSLDATYQKLRTHWREMTLEMQRLEEENNRIFIDAYGLQDELSPEISLNEITLTCNPHYRYGGDKAEAELETLLLADTMREFISYAVGCMFGRYSLDKPGLVLANQGDTLADYLRQVPQPTFTPDADNVIPLLDGEWFNDDITERFRSFLRLTFGETHYAENLKFIEDALGKDIRKFFLKDFYTDHVKRYKKRPIYWLFSSPKGSFNALIYLHRYRPDTASVVLQYLRDFQEKLTGERKRQEQISISPSASQADKTRALKSIDSLKKTLTELDDYERDVLHPMATQQISIDLDDGVKVNYLKLGAALKKIPGLEAKEEE